MQSTTSALQRTVNRDRWYAHPRPFFLALHLLAPQHDRRRKHSAAASSIIVHESSANQKSGRELCQKQPAARSQPHPTKKQPRPPHLDPQLSTARKQNPEES
ncbi:hypothetical protein M3J09_013154 [Ascochyta lentis]